MTRVTGGVDTHLDVHVAAALDEIGGLLGTAAFRADAAGYGQLLDWLRGFGEVARVGVEAPGPTGPCPPADSLPKECRWSRWTGPT